MAAIDIPSNKVIPIAVKKPRATPKGRQVDPAARAAILSLLADAPLGREYLIENLHRLQDSFGELSAKNLAALADVMRLSQAEVYEVATFYHHFDVVKEGEASPASVTVRVCTTLSCAIAGGKALHEALSASLGPGVRVVEAPCIGRCAEAPAACVHQREVGQATQDQVTAWLQAAQRGGDPRDRLRAGVCADDGNFDPLALLEPGDYVGRPQGPSRAYAGMDAYRKHGGYALYEACVGGGRDVEWAIQAMEDSGLRGLGGAGFPAGRKWRIVGGYAGPRHMAVNIDEGEPGTFKDRFYLERDPHRFLEGMLIAAWAVKIDAIWIYLRDEYHQCRDILTRALAELKGSGWKLPKIELRRGAGAYICGEESAMIESIEGKRGEPRLRPPFVAEVGVFGRPTLEHNFETLYWVRDILTRGPDWFASFGRHGRKGLRSFSVSGRVVRPGVHLAPAGITVVELIDEYCGGMQAGHSLYAYLPGGASGGILPASMGNIPLDFDTLQPHGCFIGSAAIVVLSQYDKARDAAVNLMEFFAHESCGQCTPCRVGTEKAVALLKEKQWRAGLLNDLSRVMVDASICGLGQAAPNPIQCVLKHFAHEIS